jgi:predicted nucleic acid-binding Zn ribbon protein
MAQFKRSNEQNMGEALSEWLDRYRLRQGTDNSRVLQAWDEVMGPSVARQTSRKKVENGVLIIQLDSSVVRKELLMVKAKIVSAINEHVGRSAIKDLHIF